MKFLLLTFLLCNNLGSGWTISDDEILTYIQDVEMKITELAEENVSLKSENEEIMKLFVEQIRTNEELGNRLAQLEYVVNGNKYSQILETETALNTTIDERVTILEAQMSEAQEEITQLQDQNSFLFDEIATLDDGQILQDQRILNIEQDTSGLDDRVDVLEEGGGGDVTALEERVEVLEVTAVTFNERLLDVESTVEDLQAIDDDFNTRITDLEEGGGGGSGPNATIAFRADMTGDDIEEIPFGSTLIFSDLKLNIGNGYEPLTGVFTVPSGGEGVYYFSSHYTVMYSEYAYIDIRVNGQAVCTVLKDSEETPGDWSNGGCSAVVQLAEGDEVQNVYWQGTDPTPLYEVASGVYNGFSGFRIY